MKRIVTLTILLIIAFGPIASTLVFLSARAKLRVETERALKEGVEEAYAEEIRTASSEISREIRFVRDDEFYYRGELYDVISREREGDTIVFKAIRDEKERDLVEKYLDSEKSGKCFRAVHNFKLPGIFHFHATTNSGFSPGIHSFYPSKFPFLISDALDRERTPDLPPPKI